jgi:hypothetical protein
MAVRKATGGKVDWAPDVDGVAGSYTNIPEVRKWTLAPTTAAKEYASSSTSGARKRLGGVDDFKVSIDLYIDADNRVDSDLGIKPGVLGWMKLYEDGTTFHVAPVYVDDTNFNVDIEGGGIVEGSIAASSNGTLVSP